MVKCKLRWDHHVGCSTLSLTLNRLQMVSKLAQLPYTFENVNLEQIILCYLFVLMYRYGHSPGLLRLLFWLITGSADNSGDNGVDLIDIAIKTLGETFRTILYNLKKSVPQVPHSTSESRVWEFQLSRFGLELIFNYFDFILNHIWFTHFI